MSEIKPIVGYGSPILRKVCHEAENTPAAQELISWLRSTVGGMNGGEVNPVGLAAPQINVDSRVFLMKPRGIISIIINPIITKREKSFVFKGDGCLSIPKVTGNTSRHDKIEVEFYDEFFQKKKMRLHGFAAVVFQHEYDHLNGVLFTDRLSKEGLEEIKDKLADIEKVKPSYEMIYYTK